MALTIIGLGSAGCNVAEFFEKDDAYKVKLLDCNIEGENCYSLEQYNTPEEYEKNSPDLSEFFKDVTGRVLFIVGGSGKVSGASLKILSQLKDREISVLYIVPDIGMLDTTGKLQNRLTYSVLQEYARSGMFKSIYLISNLMMESILGDISIVEYNTILNRLIFNVFDGIEKFAREQPLVKVFSEPKEMSRIATVGLYSLEEDSEKMFFSLDYIDDKQYFFAINEDELKNNGKLFKQIKESMRDKSSDKTKISYKIHSTARKENYCFVVAWSRKIQE